jgi:hypothetical protein
VVGFSLGHGRWAYGARSMVIDGLIDLVGGSGVFYQSQVKLVKV